MDDSPSSSTPTKSAYSTDPTLYLYTSLTAGSSHIITATSRIETILKANKIPFQGLDVATDEKARMLWGRRAGKRKLPGLVKMGMVVGDLEEIEDWNEYGELHEKIGEVRAPVATPSQSVTATPTNTPSKQVTPIAAASEGKPKGAAGGVPTPFTIAMKQAGEEAAEKAAESKSSASLKSAGAKAPATVPETETPVPVAIKETPETPRTITSESTKSIVPSSPPPKEGVTSHRGSTVSPASKEEIRDIEAKTAISEEDEDEDEEEDEDEDDDDDQEEKPTAKPAPPTKTPISQPKTTEESDEESSSGSEEEESNEDVKHTSTTKPPIAPRPKPAEESDEEGDSNESEDEDEGEGEDEGKVPTKPTATAKPLAVKPKTKERNEDESEEEEDSDDDGDDDDDEVEEVGPPNARPSTSTPAAKSSTSTAAVKTQPSPVTPSAETTDEN